MRIDPHSISGRRLRRHGVSLRCLEKTRMYTVGWLPGSTLTLPMPFLITAILMKKDLLNLDADGELTDGPELAPLVHQLCHVHQRLEWGIMHYLWRHLRARLRRQDTPIRFSQVERECFQAAHLTQEHYLQEQEQ